MVNFPCGCNIDPDNFHPYSVRLDCPEVFKMLTVGHVKGTWQLETSFGKTQTKKLKPTNIYDLAVLGAILRPGVSEAHDVDGTNMVERYCNRKNGLEEIKYLHPSLEPILKDTLGVVVFQETAMRICKDLAGFTDAEADNARAAIGKKQTDKMAEIKKKFFEGVQKCGLIDMESATQLFNQIEASQRYSFCLAHAVEYALYTYVTAYMKFHFPLEFFCSYLSFASEKIDPDEEKHELINECRLFDIEVLPPDLRWQKANFHIEDNKIYFGMGNVKGVGPSKIKKLLRICQESTKDVGSMTWFELLIYILSEVDVTTVENLTLVGTFDYLKIPRIRMHYEYGIWNRLTDKEKEWIKTSATKDTLIEAIREAAHPKKEGGACANVKRVAELQDLVKILQHPPFVLRDSSGKIAIDEQKLLGISLTAHETDAGAAEATCTCKEFLAGYTGEIKLAVVITRIKEHITKKGASAGKMMAFLTVEDASCALDSVLIFAEDYDKHQSLLVESNTVLLYGIRSKDNSFIIKKVVQI